MVVGVLELEIGGLELVIGIPVSTVSLGGVRSACSPEIPAWFLSDVMRDVTSSFFSGAIKSSETHATSDVLVSAFFGL